MTPTLPTALLPWLIRIHITVPRKFLGWQADLSLPWIHMSKGTFTHVAVYVSLTGTVIKTFGVTDPDLGDHLIVSISDPRTSEYTTVNQTNGHNIQASIVLNKLLDRDWVCWNTTVKQNNRLMPTPKGTDNLLSLFRKYFMSSHRLVHDFPWTF